MHEDHEKNRRDWRIPDELWERIVPLLPLRKLHPLANRVTISFPLARNEADCIWYISARRATKAA
jgi:hypothetical protein